MKLKDFSITECDIQVMLVKELESKGYIARCECRFPSGHHRSGWMRIDVVVFMGDEILCFIEVKKAGKKQISLTSRQRFAYKDSGYKTFYCIGEDDIFPTLDCVDRLAELKERGL